MIRPVDAEGLAARFIALEVHESTHDRLVWGMRHNRDMAVAGVPEWEELRELASQIKEHTLTHLDHYLEEFEANATKLGTHVHWARDAEEHNAVVHRGLPGGDRHLRSDLQVAPGRRCEGDAAAHQARRYEHDKR